MPRVIYQGQPYLVQIFHQSEGKFKNSIEVACNKKSNTLVWHGNNLSTKRHKKLIDALMRLFDYEVGTRCRITKNYRRVWY